MDCHLKMNHVLISTGLFLFLFNASMEAAKKEFNPLKCVEWGPNYYNCTIYQHDSAAGFEIGDKTWKTLKNAKMFDIKVAYSSQDGKDLLGALRIEKEETFNQFPYLESLFITTKNISFPYDVVSDTTKWGTMRSHLFNINGLKELKINDTGFNVQRHFWKLPTTLKHLRLVNQDYTRYDLRRCVELEVLDFSNNSLFEMPILSTPLPPLRELYLSRNPMYKFAVEDIAPLCDLRVLSIDYAGMGSRHRNCECLKLKEWISFLKAETHEDFVFLGTLNCNSTINETFCHDYGYTLSNAKELRNQCVKGEFSWQSILHADTKMSDSGSSTTFIISAVSVMIVLIVLTIGGVYVYANYTRQNANLNVATPN